MKANKINSDNIEALEVDYLYINTSQLPASGNGLYTAVEIYKTEIIAYYKGEILTDTQAKLRAKKGEDKYFINLIDGRILDSMKTKCFAKYANDAVGFLNSNFKNNAKIALDESNQVCLIATRKINVGEEIFCSYGKQYWKKHCALLTVKQY